MLYTSYFIMLTFIFVIGKYRGSYFKYRLVIFTYTQTEKKSQLSRSMGKLGF